VGEQRRYPHFPGDARGELVAATGSVLDRVVVRAVDVHTSFRHADFVY